MKHLLAVALVALVGCGQKIDPPTRPPASTDHLVPVIGARGNTYSLKVNEVCIEGVIYLVTETGGISAKFVNVHQDTGSIHGYVWTCQR